MRASPVATPPRMRDSWHIRWGWDSPEREKKRDFARDGRAGTRGRPCPPLALPPSVLSPLFCSCAWISFLFFVSFFFTGAFRRFEGKKGGCSSRRSHLYKSPLENVRFVFYHGRVETAVRQRLAVAVGMGWRYVNSGKKARA
jgi:hypothetical protein